MPSPYDSSEIINTIIPGSAYNLLKKRLIHTSLKLALPFVKSDSNNKKGAIVQYAAANFGSLGDQAMYTCITEGLKKKGYNEITLLSPERPSEIDLSEPPERLLNQNFYFEGTTKKSFHFQKILASNDGLFIIGADVMDGYYSKTSTLRKIHLLQLASDLGLPTKVFGFSFNENPEKDVVAALKRLPQATQLLARDPVSQGRLEDKLNRPIRLVADLAFLLQPNSSGQSARPTIDWIEKQKQDGARVIGINANPLLALDNFKDPLPIATGIAHTIDELSKADEGLRFVMISHDSRGQFNDFMLNRIAAEISCFANPTLRNKLYIMPNPCTAAEVKSVCGHLDLAITGRMHLAIACLGQSTPALCIGYQGKMEGLYEHFDLQNMVISPNEAFKSKSLVKSATNLLSKTQELKTKIEKKLPHVLSLAKSNFD
ncbi:hypothetical protein A9Q88_09200 [Gammaproteobacteria bacterium 50_400_T64]|nr:hypothetical protein A9Q88_09200 [Gammaproteobacteria bacterium 50_400_T64]